MGSVEALIAHLQAIQGLATNLQEQLTAASRQLEQAGTLLGRAISGSRNPHAHEAMNALQRSGAATVEAFALLGRAQGDLGAYTSKIGGGTSPADVIVQRRDSKSGSDEFPERERRLGLDPATGGKFRRNEVLTGVAVEKLRGVVLMRSPDREGPDWIGSDGKTYDAVGPFPSKFFDWQWPKLKDAIVGHLDKSDYVPVDISQFTPEQVAMVREFIGPLGPRVFTVGD